MDRLVSDSVWKEIEALTRNAKRVRAAVAYVTAPRALHLKRGDGLVTDASVAAIRSGQTSAKALRGLVRRGVEVSSLPGLHAKVVVADNWVIVGSANASQASANDLVEAALISNSRTALATARSFITQLENHADRLTRANIDVLCKIKVTQRGRDRVRTRPALRVRLGGKNAWFYRVRDLDENRFPDELPDVERATRLVERKFGVEDPCSLRWVGRGTIRRFARGGDLIVMASSKRRGLPPYSVSPPVEILYRQDGRSWSRFYYAEELAEPLRSVKWAEFKRLAKAAGLRISRGGQVSMATMVELIRIWPRA